MCLGRQVTSYSMGRRNTARHAPAVLKKILNFSLGLLMVWSYFFTSKGFEGIFWLRLLVFEIFMISKDFLHMIL